MSENQQGTPLSGLPTLIAVDGEIYLEVIRRSANSSGSFVNYKVALNDLILKGEKGDKGDKGDRGERGQDGTAGANGQSAYELAVAGGFVGTPAEFIASLKGEKGDAGERGQDGLQGTDGKSAYQSAVELGFEGTEAEWLESLKSQSIYAVAQQYGFEGTEEELFAQLLAPQVSAGCVYITDVTPINPVDNVGEKVRTDDGHTLLECSSSTNNVLLTVEALSGPGSFTPKVTVLGSEVPMTLLSDTGTRFRGSVAIDLNSLEGSAPYVLTAEHGDGGETQVTVNVEQAPVVTSAVFTGGYPNGQTELKAGDKVAVSFETDVPVVAYQIADHGALTASQGGLTTGTVHALTECTVADRGINTQNLGFRVRVQTASGTWSEWFDSNTVGNPVNGQTYMQLNNSFPAITFGAVNYPAGKGALGEGDAAVVNHTVTNADVYSYTSNGELTVSNPNQFEAAKTVTYLAGSYNISTNNLTLKATRTANGAETTRATVVKIATVLPSISIATPAARLRSGGNNGTQVQNHTITLTSSQELAEAPALNAPEGSWVGNWTPNAARTVWTRTLAVHDDNAKGEFSFNSLVARSLSGQEQTAIANGATYVLGGFVFRTLQVAAFPNRTTAIGTDVVNTAKLRCTNLSKGASGSLNFTYQADTTGAANRYTIQNGDTWYNCDDANAVSNTGGLMQIELEEVV